MPLEGFHLRFLSTLITQYSLMVVISTRKVLELEAMFLQALTLDFCTATEPIKVGHISGTHTKKWFIIALILDLWWMWKNIG